MNALEECRQYGSSVAENRFNATDLTPAPPVPPPSGVPRVARQAEPTTAEGDALRDNGRPQWIRSAGRDGSVRWRGGLDLVHLSACVGGLGQYGPPAVGGSVSRGGGCPARG